MQGGEKLKNNLVKLRAKHDLTQDKLAELLKVSRQTIISIEKERYTPSLNLAFKLSHLFNCEIKEIFFYKEE